MIRLALVAILAMAFTAQAQTYSVPAKLPIDLTVNKVFGKWFIAPAREPGLVPEQLFPIGWSKDGKFAYYFEPVDEACGCYFAHLIIQDMRTDKVLWEFEYNQGDKVDPVTGDMPPEDTIRKLWRKNSKLFSSKLRENGIVPSRSTLLGKSFDSGGHVFNATATADYAVEPDFGYDAVTKYSFSLASPKLGNKVLFSATKGPADKWLILDVGIVGAIKSPFEDRVAVIGMNVERGWEGPPHTGYLRLIGADLRKW